jgi:hypothetical protein
VGPYKRIGVVHLRDDLLVAATEVPDEVVDVQGEAYLWELLLVGVQHAQ